MKRRKQKPKAETPPAAPSMWRAIRQTSVIHHEVIGYEPPKQVTTRLSKRACKRAAKPVGASRFKRRRKHGRPR